MGRKCLPQSWHRACGRRCDPEDPSSKLLKKIKVRDGMQGGREAQEGGNIYIFIYVIYVYIQYMYILILIVDSCCTAATTTAL